MLNGDSGGWHAVLRVNNCAFELGLHSYIKDQNYFKISIYIGIEIKMKIRKFSDK